MKPKLTIAFLFFGWSTFAQVDQTIEQGHHTNMLVDCELITHNVVNKLTLLLTRNDLDSFDIVIGRMIRLCGITETTQRLIILRTMLKDEPTLDSIRFYFRNDYQITFQYRMNDSRQTNYGYLYTGDKVYYGYVPLRHPIDSLVMSKSRELLRKPSLTLDEELVCTLFSGEMEQFYELLEESRFRESYIVKYLKNERRAKRNYSVGLNLYAGMYTPIGSDKIFGNSPTIGFTVSSPLYYRLIIEIGVNVRVNINDQDFRYFAMGDTNTVNSDQSISLSVFAGYKIYESNRLIVLPRLGVGLITVDTGLSEKKNNSEESKYYDIKTLHLSLGVSVMTPVFKTHYIGVGVNYHYSPYQWDKDLHTRFNNNGVSAELFWKF